MPNMYSQSARTAVTIPANLSKNCTRFHTLPADELVDPSPGEREHHTADALAEVVVREVLRSAEEQHLPRDVARAEAADACWGRCFTVVDLFQKYDSKRSS